MNIVVNTILYALYLILSVLAYPILSLQDATLPSGFTSAITPASTVLAPLNLILPISDLLAILSFVVLYELAYGTYKLIKWGYSKIPGIT